jgi:hypothetical protein
VPLGLAKLRLHDFARHSRDVAPRCGRVPLRRAPARCGHDPDVLLRTYAKRTRKADTTLAAIIGVLSAGVVRWVLVPRWQMLPRRSLMVYR